MEVNLAEKLLEKSSSTSESIVADDPRRNEHSEISLSGEGTRKYLTRLRRMQRKWASLLDSLRQHNRIQNAKDPELGNFGPLVRFDDRGNLELNRRTVARRLYTEKLLSLYPLLDSVDLKIFLMGFEAGEEWSDLDKLNWGKESARNDAGIAVTSAWLTPGDRQWIKTEILAEWRRHSESLGIARAASSGE